MPIKKAAQKPLIVKPSTMDETANSTKALMTSKKKPSVNMVIGKVSRIKMGLTTALAMDKIKAVNKAVFQSLIKK